MRSETPKKVGVALEHLDRLRAEAAAGFVDDAAKSFVRLPIVGHGREAQQRQRVLDLGAGVEADVPDEAVGNPRPHQGLLEAAGEEVVAIENRHLGPTSALALAGQQRLGEASGFRLAVAKAHELDASPLPFPGEERLPETRLVLRDDRIGGGKDMAGGTKILLEADVDRVREVALELPYECDIRPAPAVDRLVVVAHSEEPLAMQGEHLEPSVLGKIDVLVFVGVNPIELSGPSRPVIGVMEERERGPEEKIAEVGGIRFPQPSLIFPVRAGGRQKSGGVDRSLGAVRLGDPVLDMRRGGLRRHQPVFELGDVAGDDFYRIAPAAFVLVGRKVQRLHDAAKDASGVVGVEDVEVFTQGSDFGGGAKLTGRQAVECAEPIGRRVRAERSADAVRHLACGLIGECDGKHPMRRNAIDRDAVRDGGGEGRGLAGPCPSQDQNRAVMSRGRDLGFCQGRGDRIERGGCMAGPFFEGSGRARDRFAAIAAHSS